MGGLEMVAHGVEFLLLPVFVGTGVALLARWRWYRQRPCLRLVVAGVSGAIGGLVSGWVITGSDGHTLGYGLLVLLCSVAILLAGGRAMPPSKGSVKNRTASGR